METATKVSIVGMSDPGIVRSENEDAIHWDAAAGWAVLADGMGGHLAGDVASRMAIDILSSRLAEAGEIAAADAGELLRASVAEANRQIHIAARSDAMQQNMGTTLVAVLCGERQLTAAHVGDSRLYRYRAGQLQQLSHDHSLVQELVDEGLMSQEDAASSKHRNVITRALGLSAEVEVDLLQSPLQPGDIYLLCSDGLTDKLSDEEVAGLLQGELADAPGRLISEANARGGEDNISVILVGVI